MREELANDPFMQQCVITGSKENVSWEHCWTYGGKQINELWAIVPLLRSLNVNMSQEVKDKCRYFSLKRATDKDLAKYPKKNWKQIKSYLNNKYDNQS